MPGLSSGPASMVHGGRAMMKGTIVRVMAEKRFGFIQGTDGKQYFFHASAFGGFFDDLVADLADNPHIAVSFEPVLAEKGPRAENVSRLDWPNQTT